MAEPLRHRQTKGAANRYDRPTVTAPHSDSTSVSPMVTDGGAAVLRTAVAAYGGGHAALVRAPDAMRASVAVFEPLPAPLAALTLRVKESFDPRRILNPSRMYAGV